MLNVVISWMIKLVHKCTRMTLKKITVIYVHKISEEMIAVLIETHIKCFHSIAFFCVHVCSLCTSDHFFVAVADVLKYMCVWVCALAILTYDLQSTPLTSNKMPIGKKRNRTYDHNPLYISICANHNSAQ